MTCTVGMITDTPSAMMQMRTLMEDIGQSVTYTLTAAHVVDAKPLYPSLWIVISQDAADIFDVLSEWSDATILLADDMPAPNDVVHYQQWRTSFADKLCKILDKLGVPTEVDGKLTHVPVEQFEEVWVLAASLGGPESLRVFLSHINPNLPVAFVYGQHIEQGFDKTLPKVLSKASKVKLFYGEEGTRLTKSEVAVFSAHQYTTLDRRGFFHYHKDKQWDKPYTPNINQIIENVAKYYQRKMGVIIFSGTCDDGASASILLRKSGVEVWAQSPEECICSAMPEAVISANAANYIGTAEQLALELNRRYHYE